MLWCAGGADFGLAEAVEEGSILGPSVLFTGGHMLACTYQGAARSDRPSISRECVQARQLRRYLCHMVHSRYLNLIHVHS